MCLRDFSFFCMPVNKPVTQQSKLKGYEAFPHKPLVNGLWILVHTEYWILGIEVGDWWHGFQKEKIIDL